jgi:hypothetical protein
MDEQKLLTFGYAYLTRHDPVDKIFVAVASGYKKQDKGTGVPLDAGVAVPADPQTLAA